MPFLSRFGRIIVPLESYAVPEICMAAYNSNFVARSIPKGKEFLLPYIIPPLPVYNTTVSFFLLLPNKIENFITGVRKLTPGEQSNCSEHPFPWQRANP